MPHQESHLSNILMGTLLGAFAGGGLGLGVCIYLFEDPPLFTGDTVLIGAVVCGALGFFLGETFIEWLQENIWWFW